MFSIALCFSFLQNSTSTTRGTGIIKSSGWGNGVLVTVQASESFCQKTFIKNTLIILFALRNSKYYATRLQLLSSHPVDLKVLKILCLKHILCSNGQHHRYPGYLVWNCENHIEKVRLHVCARKNCAQRFWFFFFFFRNGKNFFMMKCSRQARRTSILQKKLATSAKTEHLTSLLLMGDCSTKAMPTGTLPTLALQWLLVQEQRNYCT